MLEMTDYHETHFGYMVNHDDEIREYDYPNLEALEASEQNDWLVISMKNDLQILLVMIIERIRNLMNKGSCIRRLNKTKK